MTTPLEKSVKRLRTILFLLIAVFGIALIITPASASEGVAGMDRGALVMITLIGTLLFAVVFEVWRTTLRRQKPSGNRATQHWTSN